MTDDTLKRIFDIFISLGGIVFLPLCMVAAFLVAADGGPVFFRQKRVGLHGRQFDIFKFRSMTINAEQKGTMVTAGNDSRITPIGRLLRRYKIDELPQLLNVLMGHMSIVGPRPEVPVYVEKWSDQDKKVILSVKPGVTDFASLLFINEEALLSRYPDHESAYINIVMPQKISCYRQYVNTRNFFVDLKIVIATIVEIFRKKG
ncbi:MAG: sugar transferase [Desulfobacteraceae bacterium]|nr:MAG: sugar transferase [Desulfobacteraceae bacterium]